MVNELATFKLMSISNYPGKIAYLFNGGWEDVRNSKTSIPGMNLSCSMDSEYYYSRLMHHHVGSAFAVERIFFWGGDGGMQACTGNSVQEGRPNLL